MARRYEQRNQQKQRRPLIVICSEGGKKSSEYYYFRHYASRDLRIQFSTGNSTDPTGMVEDLIRYINNEDIKSEDSVRIFLVLDTDLDEKRINEIKEIEQKCSDNNIEIITSAPTFEIWYLMHYTDSKLVFGTSKEVKRELKTKNRLYSNNLDIYKTIENETNYARTKAKYIEKQVINNKEDLLKTNPHTSIYKILDAVDEYRKLK